VRRRGGQPEQGDRRGRDKGETTYGFQQGAASRSTAGRLSPGIVIGPAFWRYVPSLTVSE
jgi:hypothetical protein